MEKKNCYVYSHIRLDNYTVFYIGIGTGKNKYRAKNKKARTVYWKNITNKTDYKIDILFDNLTHSEACLKEIELIKLHGRKDQNKGLLVNFTDGGEGRLGTQNKYTPILQYNLKGEFIKRWINVLTITTELQIPRQSIYNVLNNKRLTTNKCFWFYEKSFNKNMVYNSINKRLNYKETKSKLCDTKIIVHQYTKENIFIKSYTSISEAAKYTGSNPTAISLVINGKRKSTNNFIWKKEKVK